MDKQRTRHLSLAQVLELSVWNGTHDCKDYVMNYIELHRKYDLDTKVCSAFWYDTPENRTGRLKLERELILRWQSPFNKENWHRYGKPFGKI